MSCRLGMYTAPNVGCTSFHSWQTEISSKCLGTSFCGSWHGQRMFALNLAWPWRTLSNTGSVLRKHANVVCTAQPLLRTLFKQLNCCICSGVRSNPKSHTFWLITTWSPSFVWRGLFQTLLILQCTLCLNEECGLEPSSLGKFRNGLTCFEQSETYSSFSGSIRRRSSYNI